MGLSGWRTYDLSIIADCPDELGIYELGDEEKITLYYGYGKIRTRLLEHIDQNEFSMARYFRFELFETEEECRVRKRLLLHEYEEEHDILPHYNERDRFNGFCLHFCTARLA
jgi:hypothetical protein